MKPVLNIQIGSRHSTDVAISKDLVERVVKGMLSTLSINTDIVISITDNTDLLIINDHVCRYPVSLTKEISNYIQLIEKVKPGDPEKEMFGELLINQVLWIQPHVLFPDECLHEHIPFPASITGMAYEVAKENALDIIAEMINMRIPLSNRSLINDISNKYLTASKIEWNGMREELIAALLATEVEIVFNRDYFTKFITALSRENLFELMRDGLYYENGIKYPPFRIIFDDNLPFNAYCFRLNGFTTIPAIGLPDDSEILVNTAIGDLVKYNIKGRATTNPGNGNEASFISSADKKIADAAGLNSWDCLGYCILCFSRFLRDFGYCFVDKKMISEYLKKVEQIYPKFDELMKSSDLLSLSTKTFRLLAKEEISIRNLRVIAEAIMESDYIIADPNEYIIFDERVAIHAAEVEGWKDKAGGITEFVRARLKRNISYKYTRGKNVLDVYLLDKEIEKMADPVLNEQDSSYAEKIKKIIEAVDNELNLTFSSYDVLVVLTSVNVRRYFKKIIETTYPKVTVLSYQELSPDLSIQPIARISLQ